MNAREKMRQFADILAKRYPEAVCSLEYENEPWKLMVMGRLSAQCTDARVNIVCRELFETYKAPRELADAVLSDVELIIRPCGLYRTKAADIVGECKLLCETYGGVLPDTMEELLRFPGIGRKIANLLLGDIYKKGGMVTDTHCIRICGRVGFYPEALKDPLKVERVLTPLLPTEEQSDFCHRLVLFGREICTARAPMCETCPAGELCSKRKSGI